MRTFLALALAAGIAAAQPGPESLRQSPFVTGVVLELDLEPVCEFSIRTQSNEVLWYRFDANAAVLREQNALRFGVLTSGDRVEVDSTSQPGSQLRLARTVRVLAASPSIRSLRTKPAPYHPDGYMSEADRLLLNRGNLLVTGVVSRVEDGALVLRTRERGEQTFHVRSDTKYLERGARAQASDVKPDMRVFVRAGRDIFGAPEVYEVAWGTILEPR